MGRLALGIGITVWALGTASLAGAESEAAASSVDCGPAVAARVQAHYDGVRDLAARFEQTISAAAMSGSSLADEAPSRGSMVLAKPGRMRWDYETPEPSLVVSDGSVLWLYDPMARQAQRLDVGEGALSAAALQFLIGGGNLQESFVVSGLECAGESHRIGLKPRETASYERLELLVAMDGVILETSVVDLLGNETVIRFEDIRTNQSPEDSVFRFEVPKGTDVIDLSRSS